MAVVTGRLANIGWASHTHMDGSATGHDPYEFSLDIPHEVYETTAFQSTGPRTYIPSGLYTGNGSYSMYYDSAQNMPPISEITAAADTLTLTTTTGKTIAASAICTGVGWGVALDGVETITVNFQMTGAITITN